MNSGVPAIRGAHEAGLSVDSFEIGKDGNIELDPRFESAEAGDFRPAVGSPVVDAGCFESLGLDQDGARQDIGAHAVGRRATFKT